MLTTRQYRWLTGLAVLGIAVACALPAERIPKFSPVLSLDKIAHVLMFAGLGWVSLRGFVQVNVPEQWAVWKQALKVTALGVLFAVGTEVFQHVMPIRRRGDPYDALADLLGLALAVGLWQWRLRRRRVLRETST